jgi:septal ring-binding cell division protein DamX
MLLASVAVASARGERELTDEELRAEIARNKALAAYVARNGDPDIAETRFLSDTPPWDDHEVTLYYLDSRKEIGFARAWILGRPEVQLQRYERPLTDEQIAALASRARPRATTTSMAALGPDERAEGAARRAEAAASRVEAAADTAERAADRAEAVSSKMESAFHRALRK